MAASRLPQCSNNLSSFQALTMEDIRTVILSTSVKSCSLDPIPTGILLECLPVLLPFITDMCNRSLSEGLLPTSQRHALVTPILKKDGLDAADVKNYRPISNLTFVSKLAERLVYSQLYSYLLQHGLLPKFQSGFRKNHSTETAILKVISDISAAADVGGVTLLGLLDMSAACYTRPATRDFIWINRRSTDLAEIIPVRTYPASSRQPNHLRGVGGKGRCAAGIRSGPPAIPAIFR